MENNNELENELIEEELTEEKERGKNSPFTFVTGLLCGVLLVLIFMTFFLWRLRIAIEKRMEQKAVVETMAETDVQGNTAAEDLDMIRLKMQAIQDCIDYYSIYNASAESTEEKVLDGMMEALNDPYSVYYTKKELDDMKESITGEYCGIGAMLTQSQDTNEIFVSRCFENSPAMEAGMERGDKIIKVDGEDISDADLEVVVSRIKSGEGTPVILTILREEEELDLEVIRRHIEVPTVESEMLENHIGYIQLLEFDSVTETQFQDALYELEEKGMECLIVDLRDNPGGILQVVVKVLDEILPEGLVVYTEDKYGEREEYYSDEEHQLKVPMAVLINGNSASAAEIFAGAVKDYGCGILVGETTFGKGIVQNNFNFKDGTGIKLTVAKYFTPKGNDIHGVGVEPDVQIELDFGDATEYSIEADNQLQKAIEIVTDM